MNFSFLWQRAPSVTVYYCHLLCQNEKEKEREMIDEALYYLNTVVS